VTFRAFRLSFTPACGKTKMNLGRRFSGMIPHRSLTWLTWLIWLALPAGFFLVPTAAFASCGHYVKVGRSAVEPQQAVPRDAQQAPSLPGKPPCSGPTCSEQPTQTPVPPAPSPLSTLAEWGWLGNGLLALDAAVSALPWQSASCAPIRLPFRIE